jgi:hypothetical protein
MANKFRCESQNIYYIISLMKNSKAKTSENSSDRLQASQTLQLRTRRDSTEKQFSMTDNNYRKEMNNSSDNKKNGNSGVFSTLDTVEDLSTRDNVGVGHLGLAC